MTLIRMNLCPESGRACLHGSRQDPTAALRRAAHEAGPVVLMLHGYKYAPNTRDCPHGLIFSTDHANSWPVQLGLASGGALGVSIGWPARGPLNRVFREAGSHGAAVARLIAMLHQTAPHRPVHLIAHSMGSEVALSALAQAPARSVGRVILLTAASFQSHAAQALQSPAGRHAELLNVVSRENDLFDFAFEWMIPAPERGSRVLGHGIDAARALTVQLDCPATLEALTRLGSPISPSARRICHWSGYTRPGAMAFYARCLLTPEALPLHLLRHALPATHAPQGAAFPWHGDQNPHDGPDNSRSRPL